jgi:hypothetical protein
VLGGRLPPTTLRDLGKRRLPGDELPEAIAAKITLDPLLQCRWQITRQPHIPSAKADRMPPIAAVLLVLLVCVLFGTVLVHAWSAGWGPWPSGAVGPILIILVVLLLLGRI